MKKLIRLLLLGVVAVLGWSGFTSCNDSNGSTDIVTNESIDINSLHGHTVVGTSLGDEENSSIKFFCHLNTEGNDGDSMLSWNGQQSYYNIVGDVIVWIPEDANMSLDTLTGGTPGSLEVGETYFIEGGPDTDWTILDIVENNCSEEVLW